MRPPTAGRCTGLVGPHLPATGHDRPAAESRLQGEATTPYRASHGPALGVTGVSALTRPSSYGSAAASPRQDGLVGLTALPLGIALLATQPLVRLAQTRQACSLSPGPPGIEALD